MPDRYALRNDNCARGTCRPLATLAEHSHTTFKIHHHFQGDSKRRTDKPRLASATHTRGLPHRERSCQLEIRADTYTRKPPPIPRRDSRALASAPIITSGIVEMSRTDSTSKLLRVCIYILILIISILSIQFGLEIYSAHPGTYSHNFL